MFQQQQHDKPEMQGGFNLVYLILHGFATSVTPFMRTDFGKEAFGINSFVALLLMIGFGSFGNSHAMWVFLLLWILAVLRQRVTQMLNRKKGLICHSRYQGYPWLAFKLFPRIKDEGNAKGAEAFFVMSLGALLGYCLDPALGWFLVMGGIGALCIEAFAVEVTKRRLQSMRDAEIEQRDLAERFRNGRF